MKEIFALLKDMQLFELLLLILIPGNLFANKKHQSAAIGFLVFGAWHLLCLIVDFVFGFQDKLWDVSMELLMTAMSWLLSKSEKFQK